MQLIDKANSVYLSRNMNMNMNMNKAPEGACEG
jgi:hypothetical protein